MKYLFILTIVISSFQLQANQSYFLTSEEVEAGFAVRDSNAQEDPDLLAGNPEKTASDATRNSATNDPFGTGTTGGSSSPRAISLATKIKAAMSSAASIMAIAAPAIAKVAIATAVAVSVAPIVLKVAKGVLAAAVTGVCYWLGLPLDWSATVGAAAPMAVENAGSWVKQKFLRVPA